MKTQNFQCVNSEIKERESKYSAPKFVKYHTGIILNILQIFRKDPALGALLKAESFGSREFVLV